jgi:hypothetical protein
MPMDLSSAHACVFTIQWEDFLDDVILDVLQARPDPPAGRTACRSHVVPDQLRPEPLHLHRCWRKEAINDL